MSLDTTAVTDVAVSRIDADLWVEWWSLAAAGTTFQVYVDRRLAWHGTARRCLLPSSAASMRIEVGALTTGFGVGGFGVGGFGVPLDESQSDLSATLPSPASGGSRIKLTWVGGTFLGTDITKFHVYTGLTPGGAVSYASPAGVVPAYSAGGMVDGFGVAGFGGGGFGAAPGSYEWTSAPVAAGTWNVAVKAVSASGNEGTAETDSVVVAGPPQPPARAADGKRLTAVVSYPSGGFGRDGFGAVNYGAAGSPVATLSWLASPGA